MELNRYHKVMIFLLGRLGELQAQGLVESGGSLTAAGLTEYTILKASGFTPTERELEVFAPLLGAVDGLHMAKLIRRES